MSFQKMVYQLLVGALHADEKLCPVGFGKLPNFVYEQFGGVGYRFFRKAKLDVCSNSDTSKP